MTKTLIQSIDRATAILDVVAAAGQPLRAVEIADNVHLELKTAHNIIRSLFLHNFLAQEADGRYVLGRKSLELGNRIKDRYAVLGACARGPVTELAGKTGCQTFFGCEYFGSLYGIVHVNTANVAQINGPQAWLNAIHATSAGKIIISELGLEWFARLCRREKLEKFTPRTIVTPEEMAPALENIRKNGYDLSIGEHLPDLAALGIAVRAPGGEFLGALVQTFPEYAISSGHLDIPRRVAVLQECARAIGRAFDRENARGENRGP